MTTVPAPDPWAEIAAELRRIADDAEKLVGEPAPCYFALNIQPYTPDELSRSQAKHYAATVRATDAVAAVLLGKYAKTYKLSGGSFHHGADGRRGPVEVRIFQAVADPAAVDPQAEIERLRARVAELEARDAQGFSRAADGDEAQKLGAREPLHTGGVVDGGQLVDETPAQLVSDGTIAEAAAMEERDRLAGGPPWEVANHPENAQPGGWHHGQIR